MAKITARVSVRLERKENQRKPKIDYTILAEIFANLFAGAFFTVPLPGEERFGSKRIEIATGNQVDYQTRLAGIIFWSAA